MAPYPSDMKNLSFIAGANVPQTSGIKKRKPRPKRVYIPPTQEFPYKIPKRVDFMSRPRDYYDESEYMHPVNEVSGVRTSALRGVPTQRVLDVAMPQIRHIINTKNVYRNTLNKERLEKLDQLLQASKATCYTKFCKTLIEQQTSKRPAGKITETAWRKHLEYLNEIAKPKVPPEPEPVSRGDPVPLATILPRLKELAQPNDNKMYRRLSQEDWYRPPGKVPSAALSYMITPRIKKLAEHKIHKEPTIAQLLNLK